MATTRERFYSAEGKIGRALAAVEADTGASPMLLGVIKELRKRSKKVLYALHCADDALFEYLIEMKQAAESAKYVSEADKDSTGKTRKAVLNAYTSVASVRCCRN